MLEENVGINVLSFPYQSYFFKKEPKENNGIIFFKKKYNYSEK